MLCTRAPRFQESISLWVNRLMVQVKCSMIKLHRTTQKHRPRKCSHTLCRAPSRKTRERWRVLKTKSSSSVTATSAWSHPRITRRCCHKCKLVRTSIITARFHLRRRTNCKFSSPLHRQIMDDLAQIIEFSCL